MKQWNRLLDSWGCFKMSHAPHMKTTCLHCYTQVRLVVQNLRFHTSCWQSWLRADLLLMLQIQLFHIQLFPSTEGYSNICAIWGAVIMLFSSYYISIYQLQIDDKGITHVQGYSYSILVTSQFHSHSSHCLGTHYSCSMIWQPRKPHL